MRYEYFKCIGWTVLCLTITNKKGSLKEYPESAELTLLCRSRSENEQIFHMSLAPECEADELGFGSRLGDIPRQLS